MDSDVRDFDVDKDLHLPLSLPHSGDQDIQDAIVRSHSDTFCVEPGHHVAMDLAVPPSQCDLG